MGLYDKYARLAGERLQFSDNGLTPFGTCIDCLLYTSDAADD